MQVFCTLPVEAPAESIKNKTELRPFFDSFLIGFISKMLQMFWTYAKINEKTVWTDKKSLKVWKKVLLVHEKLPDTYFKESGKLIEMN